MKHPFLKSILFIFSVTVSMGISAQVEQSQEAQSNDDSLKVVVPTSEYADLKMITPPASFVVSEAFNGYISYQTSSAIIMTLIHDANYLKISEGMTDEFYANNKLTFISETKIETEYGYKGRAFKASFLLEGDEYIRYMVYIGDLEKTLWLSITYPKMVEELVEEELLKSIQTVNINPETDEIEK